MRSYFGDTTLAMIVLLFAAGAFVVDVVSPFTPTPNAASAKNLLLLCFGLLALTLAFHLSANVGESSVLLCTELNLPPRRRSLIALNCPFGCVKYKPSSL
jgi:hypothetical protein